MIEARNWRSATLLQLGRTVESEAETAAVRHWAASSGRPFFVALAAMDSSPACWPRVGSTRRKMPYRIRRRSARQPELLRSGGGSVVPVRFAQGTLGELLAVIESFLDAGQAPFTWRAAHVLALAQTGDQRAVDTLRAQVAVMRTAPRNWLWLTAVALLADACIAVGDRRSARALELALRPYRSDTVVVAHGIATLGPVAGRLDASGALIALCRTTRKSQAPRRRVVSTTNPFQTRHKQGNHKEIHHGHRFIRRLTMASAVAVTALTVSVAPMAHADTHADNVSLPSPPRRTATAAHSPGPTSCSTPAHRWSIRRHGRGPTCSSSTSGRRATCMTRATTVASSSI